MNNLLISVKHFCDNKPNHIHNYPKEKKFYFNVISEGNKVQSFPVIP
jgi:hypothetical protein